jgi:hypothetical protein
LPTFNPSDDYSAYIATSAASSMTVSSALAGNQHDHEGAQDYTWSTSEVVDITLNRNSISVANGVGVTVEGTIATIKSSGTYRVTGTLDNGQIIIGASSNALVRVILNGVKITCASNAPIYAVTADKVILVLAASTQNEVADSAGNQDDGVIYAKADLTICGEGSLSVTSNKNDAIRSSDGLIIKSGNIQVASVDDGVCGKDYIVVKGGHITVNSVGDAFKSDNDVNTNRGYVSIEQGTLALTSTHADAISAETDILVTGGTFTVTSGGGGNIAPANGVSTKALKGKVSVVIDNGDFTINSSDDAIHSNDTIIINNGKYVISTGDDAVHADNVLEVNGGSFAIVKCYEGLESADLTINNGYFQISSSDDGLNAAGGNDGSSGDWTPGQGGFPGFPPAGNYSLVINGGFIYIDAYGDGMDINGRIEMSGGVLIINGPLANDNGAIDYDTTFKVTGGTIIAAGSSGMAMAPSTSSTVRSVLIRFSAAQQANKLVNIQTAAGETLLTFSPTKTYQALTYCSSSLAAGSYSVYLGGTTTGSANYGVYSGGTYSGGTRYRAFTINGMVTNVM